MQVDKKTRKRLVHHSVKISKKKNDKFSVHFMQVNMNRCICGHITILITVKTDFVITAYNNYQ